MPATETAPANAPIDVHTSGDAPPPPRILVVEDDGDIRRLNTEVLRRFGYLVDAAVDGDAGWAAINAQHYDLLITDNGMPKLTGLGLLQKLRSARVVLPVIMATGAPPMQKFVESPWLIPDATLVKPYTVSELLAAVHSVLRNNGDEPEPTDPSEPLVNGVWQAFKLSKPD